MSNHTTCNCIQEATQYAMMGALAFPSLLFALLWSVYFRRYRSLLQSPRSIRRRFSLQLTNTRLEAPVTPQPVTEEDRGPAGGKGPGATEGPREERPVVAERPATTLLLPGGCTVRSASRRLWKGLQQAPRFTKSDLNLLQLIKAGKEGIFYQARMSRGTCKGHSMFTCKISKEGVRPKHVEMEISIMRKLAHHKNILQLLDWNTAEEPSILIMEYISCGTLRTFLQTQRPHLISDPELPSLLTIASYHIALAVQHLHSKMIVHCDLALRNIMVNKFPWEVKLGEFGLARDMTSMTGRHSYRWRNPQRVPLRWYPPEYFKNNFYSFKGDVWAFGIVLWEMQTFGTLPYPNLESSEAVVYHICIGHKNTNPEGCRPEILHVMHECWQEPYSLRPTFTRIVAMLETIMENDADYVDVQSPQVLVKDDSEYHGSEGRQASSALMGNMNAI